MYVFEKWLLCRVVVWRPAMRKHNYTTDFRRRHDKWYFRLAPCHAKTRQSGHCRIAGYHMTAPDKRTTWQKSATIKHETARMKKIGADQWSSGNALDW